MTVLSRPSPANFPFNEYKIGNLIVYTREPLSRQEVLEIEANPKLIVELAKKKGFFECKEYPE